MKRPHNVFIHASAHVYVCMCVYVCVQAGQLSQPRGTLCGPVIVVLMYFFNISRIMVTGLRGGVTRGKGQKEEERRWRRKKRAFCLIRFQLTQHLTKHGWAATHKNLKSNINQCESPLTSLFMCFTDLLIDCCMHNDCKRRKNTPANKRMMTEQSVCASPKHIFFMLWLFLEIWCSVWISNIKTEINKETNNIAVWRQPLTGSVCQAQCVFYVELREALFLHSNPEGSDDTFKFAGDCRG